MPRYVIHIGASKAGSSTIQKFLQKNQAGLDRLGFLVPDKHLGVGGPVTGEHVWATAAQINAPDPAGLAATLDALEAAAGDRTILLSAENLSNLGSAAAMGALAGRDCQVIFYIRRQDEYLMSAWQQWYSKVETDMHAWLVKALRQHGHWGQVVAEWEAVTGPQSVKPRIFERSEFYQNDLVKDYCTFAGIDWGVGGIDIDVPAENISYSDAITALVTGAPGLFKDSHDLEFDKIVKRLTNQDFVPGKKLSLISAGMRDSILYFYRDENAALGRTYFPHRPLLFAPIDHSKYHYASADEIQAMQMQFLTRMVFEVARRQV